MTAAAHDVDFWGVLDEAEETVERWPWWKQHYRADVHAEAEPTVEWDAWEALGSL